MDFKLEPFVGPYSPLFELRAWRRELDRLALQHADNTEAIAQIKAAKQETDAWIKSQTNPR